MADGPAHVPVGAFVMAAEEGCMRRCVRMPGAALDAGDARCLQRCAQLFMDAFGIVARTIVAMRNSQLQQ